MYLNKSVDTGTCTTLDGYLNREVRGEEKKA